eukprot:TRINITY_DN7489_c0_g1_i1.p1 TRINITY_DN7489_c0_g1~~TRINITY_DN7489_c0_g1_i1.p1  ORF type:complete len:263 (+),score=64.46 TRINITY_DN7489_c0_g1_i1:113-790(+)
MKHSLQSINMASMRTKDRVTHAINTRLQQLHPYLDVWPQGLALLAVPQNLTSFTLQQYARMIDEMWYQCGDRTTDMNWYLKRLALAGVYSSAELHLLVDGSEGFTDTAEFVERRVDEMVVMGQQWSKVQEIGESVGTTAFNLLQGFAPSLLKGVNGVDGAASKGLKEVGNVIKGVVDKMPVDPSIVKKGVNSLQQVFPSPERIERAAKERKEMLNNKNKDKDENA